jgi:CRP-like cAMP-binding protein
MILALLCANLRLSHVENILDVAYKSIGRIITLDTSEKETFESLIEIIKIRKKERLLSAGQVCKYEYMVLKGCIRSFYCDEDTNEFTTMFAIEGWWTGDLGSFYRQMPSEYYLVAMEETYLLRLSYQRMEQLYEKIPKFERYFRILLQNRLIAVESFQNTLQALDAEENYKLFRQNYPDLEKRVPLKYIASYLGITPTYLSRLRKRKS